MSQEVIDWEDVEAAAAALAGNHRKFESFGWHDRPEDDEDWAIVYVRNRDSRLLDESNADAIAEEMRPFLEADDADICYERHAHWAVGWVEGYAVRVYARPKPGDSQEGFTRDYKCLGCRHHWAAEVLISQMSAALSCPCCQSRSFTASPAYRITDAFRKLCELNARLADYPVLDEEDYSMREYEATLENIVQCGRRWVKDNAPEDWPSQCFSWFWDNDQGAVDSRDDQGGYPRDEQMATCMIALGFVEMLPPYEPEDIEADKKLIREQGQHLGEGYYLWRQDIYNLVVGGIECSS